jgi:hypothetical protein
MKSIAPLVLTFSSTAIAAVPHLKRDLAPANTLPNGWTAAGCFVDNVSSRALSSASYTDSSGMTAQTCIAFCSSKGYPVAGTEYARECWCGSSVPAQSATDGCNMACTGDGTQGCGGPNRLTVYSNPASGAVTNPGPTGWTSLGCYTDSVNARSLAVRVNTPAALSVAVCTSACGGQGFSFAGVEYAGECWCGNTNGGTPASTGCDMTCTGNSAEYCGGSNRLNLYSANANGNPSISTSVATTTISTVPATTPSTTTTSSVSRIVL